MPQPSPVPVLTPEPDLPLSILHLCDIYVARAPSPDHLFLLADALDDVWRRYPTARSAQACNRRAAELRAIAPSYA